MKRVIAPEDVDYERKSTDDADVRAIEIAHDIHSCTYGISSDPLLLFCVVFSALIHDVDHTGLTNAELNLLQSSASVYYRKRSVAEQNSIDLSWAVLMDDKFSDLRNCIYTTPAELRRFRQLLVNAVLATDIADKELAGKRKNRWSEVFPTQGGSSDAPTEAALETNNQRTTESKSMIDRKATIVFEYIIQASDVAHCMQHW